MACVSPKLACSAQNVPSSTRIIAGLVGFFTLIHDLHRPDR